MPTDSQPKEPSPEGSEIHHILSICERFLRIGDYDSCRVFAVKAQISNSNHPGPGQILAICSILAAASAVGQPDWYSILHLPQCTDDYNSIKKNYCRLSDLLNPTKNPYSLAVQAREWVTKAWAILSEPSVKAMIDRELKTEEKIEKSGATFWTRCPNCCYMYAYERKYEDCTLRCQNVKCRCSFKAEPLPASVAPSLEMETNQVYVCYGFSTMERGGSLDGCKWWPAPFLSIHSLPDQNKGNIIGDEGSRIEKCGGSVEILGSDEADENGGCSGVINQEAPKVDSIGKQNNGVKVVRKRKKMMARTSKKAMGRGIRVDLNKVLKEEVTDEEGLEVEGIGYNKDFGCGGNINSEKGVSDAGGLKFLNGDDDIYVSVDFEN